MFGLSIMEILVIAIIAILFLGPDKLPSAMVQIAKFFKSFKNSINDAKSSFEQEMRIHELKEDTLAYKKKLDDAATSMKKTISFDELEELKNSTQNINDSLKEIEDDIRGTATLKSDFMQTNRAFSPNLNSEMKKEIKPKKPEEPKEKKINTEESKNV
ncbi:MAG: Sec-independent protein translocase protein TatB [Sulfurospirillaceae bacterium]|nr:Sec-independent protein translocase protein TatB [Sulfurospirillaceae bacterium]